MHASCESTQPSRDEASRQTLHLLFLCQTLALPAQAISNIEFYKPNSLVALAERAQVAINSGVVSPVALQGAVITANTVKADVGGQLNIESLSDTSHYNGKQQNIGGSVTVGIGFAGSVSAGQALADSSFASVAEQSGMRAGDGGFQVDVKGNTELKGGAITSTDKAVADKQL